MKTNYFLKSFVAMLLMFFVVNISAKEITVKTNGTDSDLAAALNDAEDGDVIIIDGIIFFEAPVTVEKNVKIIGKGTASTGDFFLGDGCKLFELNPEPVEGKALIFQDLGFAEGLNSGDGGVGRIIGGTTEFLNCWFEDNYSGDRGGVFYVANEGTVARFAGCEFTNNVADGRGGVLFVAGEANTSFEYCKASGNQNIRQRGSFCYIEGGHHYFYYTKIEGNIAGVSMADGEHGEGGCVVTASGCKTLTMENCAVVSNIAYDHGTAFFLMGKPNLTLINTVVAQNYTKRGAGTMFIANDAEGIDITMVNVSYIDNKSDDNAGNGGGGIRVMNLNNRFNIFNTIIARNICHANAPDNAQHGAVDFCFNSTPGITKDFIIKNSILGFLKNVPEGEIPVAQDNPSITQRSLIDMYRVGPADPSATEHVALDVSGVDIKGGMRKTVDFKMPYYRLESKDVIAAKLGDPALLNDFESEEDILRVKRTVTAGAIFAGAAQVVEADADYDDSGWQKKVVSIYDGTGINSPKITVVEQGIRIIGTPSNGILGVDFGNLKGHAVGTLVSITGQEVQKVFDLNVNAKGYYNINVAPGMYILKVVIGGKTYAQKLVVTK